MRGFYLVTALLTMCCGIVLAVTNTQLDAEESVFFKSHNLVRSGFNIQPLNWSTTLANRAQAWATGCRFEHSNGQLGPYGENIAAGTGNFTARNAMEMFMGDLREPLINGCLCVASHVSIRGIRSHQSYILRFYADNMAIYRRAWVCVSSV